MIPTPDKPVKQIAMETLETPVTRSANRYWTEITLAMLAGHYFGTRFGYLKLLAMGFAAIGMNIFLKITEANLESGK
jgi:hypothetical protein